MAKFSSNVVRPPEVPEDAYSANDAELLGFSLYTRFHVSNVNWDPSIVEAESGYYNDLITVTVIKDFMHVIGSETYTYKAFVPTTVPRHVGERLQELGLLYIGGIDVAQRRKLQAANKLAHRTIKVPRDGE